MNKNRIRFEGYKTATYQTLGQHASEHAQILAAHSSWEGEFRLNNRLMRSYYYFTATDLTDEELLQVQDAWNEIATAYSLTKGLMTITPSEE